jgi:hypothetical protein
MNRDKGYYFIMKTGRLGEIYLLNAKIIINPLNSGNLETKNICSQREMEYFMSGESDQPSVLVQPC